MNVKEFIDGLDCKQCRQGVCYLHHIMALESEIRELRGAIKHLGEKMDRKLKLTYTAGK